MVINKQVQIIRSQTMADGTIRIIIDLINGDDDDYKVARQLMREETTMILAPTTVINSVITDELGNGEIENTEPH